jgi:hypothetical protein
MTAEQEARYRALIRLLAEIVNDYRSSCSQDSTEGMDCQNFAGVENDRQQSIAQG